MGKKKKAAPKGGKKEAVKAKKPAYKMSSLYEISGEKLVRKNKKCPKCGSFLASHKDRLTCGSCKYMEKK